METESGSGSYDALQAVYQRRLSHGFQALIDYTWAHSIDKGSYGNWVTYIYAGQTSANLKQTAAIRTMTFPRRFLRR